MFGVFAVLAIVNEPAPVAGAETHEGTCSLISGNTLVVEPCSIRVSANAFSATYVLEWKSGHKTIMKLHSDGNTVNGEPALQVRAPADVMAKSECFEQTTYRDIYCSFIPGIQ
ncbi:hypothetical protein GCM10011316_10370 [Roseibium aquae]|uniref:Uncharacterized protein n=2 Tax=Roseibium aquae TaxID=1323746 RepID=A0A916TF34_9HYPH|nr:hypothetical protein GCM10011316_10370 [Roseibium aquae]